MLQHRSNFILEDVLELFHPLLTRLLNDVCVWADSPNQLHTDLLTIFARSVEYSLIFNAGKCPLFVYDGIFLSFHISEYGIKTDPEKFSAIKNRQMPKTTSEIGSFVNAAGNL